MNPSSSRMSIGYYSPGWPLDAIPSGIISYVADMAIQLKKMGHRATIVAGDVIGATHDAEVYNVRPARVVPRFMRRVLDGASFRIAPQWAGVQISARPFITVIQRAVAEQGIQVFEMEESLGLAWPVQRAISIPLCVRLHGPWFLNGQADGAPDDQQFRHRVAAEGRAIASANAVSSSSRDVLDRTRAYYNLALRDAQVIYPPSCPVPPIERWRLEDCNSKLILFIGRFDRHKGGDLVIEAFGRVLQEIPQAELAFAGPDYGYTDPAGRSWTLEQFVHDRLPGALESGKVTLLGRQPFSVLAALRRKAMVTTVCSRYENAPRALIEAMSYGCPIVAAKVGGIPEILDDQRDGLLHRSEAPDDLAAGIITLLKNPVRAQQLGANAAVTCERRFHPEIIAKQTVEFYRGLTRRRRGIA